MHSLDPTAIMISVLSLVMVPSLAEIIGPYAVIVLASTTGAAWALGEKETTSRFQAVKFFVKINMVAILVTVIIAHFIGIYINIANKQWLLSPIALSIGLLGNSWGKMGRWISAKLQNKLTKDGS